MRHVEDAQAFEAFRVPVDDVDRITAQHEVDEARRQCVQPVNALPVNTPLQRCGERVRPRGSWPVAVASAARTAPGRRNKRNQKAAAGPGTAVDLQSAGAQAHCWST